MMHEEATRTDQLITPFKDKLFISGGGQDSLFRLVYWFPSSNRPFRVFYCKKEHEISVNLCTSFKLLVYSQFFTAYPPLLFTSNVSPNHISF